MYIFYCQQRDLHVKKKKKKKHITDVILLNRVLLYSVICGLWRKTEGRTEKSEPKENTILYDYHWLYCYVELVLLFKSKNDKQQEVIKLEEKVPFFRCTYIGSENRQRTWQAENLCCHNFSNLTEWKGWKFFSILIFYVFIHLVINLMRGMG